MKSFRRFALITTIATYILIFIGGLVRVSGAGLGCPDWPTCFGRWIPPTSVEQLPPDIDPAQFNFVLAWIEYINRLCGMVVGLLIAALAIWALVKLRPYRKITIPAVVAAILTAIQGWQGSVVISSQLESAVVTVHTLLALIIVSLLLYVTQEAYYEQDRRAVKAPTWPKSVTVSLGILWLVGVIQVILGTQLRSALEGLSEKYPLLTSGEWILTLGAVNHAHMTLGVLLVAFAWVAGFSIWKYRQGFTPLMRQSLGLMLIVISGQLLLGLAFIVVELTPLLQVFHLWLASLFVGLTLVLYVQSRWEVVS
ncbi:MAG: COX15/CtaA family protein [Candidatus Zixiibacteriota bacterium]|nr:MAG: COX15/CtaA family protein [candidate division Zixibacteria bacterium]